MDPITLALLALRGVTTVLDLQGREDISNTILALIDAHHAGRNVDNHMAEVAAALEAGTELATWTDIRHRIKAETDDFLADPPGPAG